MAEPLVTIIIPVFNTREYLIECITSIINQSYLNLEILLVDDGSSDKSGELCDELISIDKRIFVIHKKNGGSNSSRESGASISTGKFIMFVDSDDWIDLNTVRECLAKAKETEAECIFFSYTREYGNNSSEVHPIIDGSIYRRIFGLYGKELRRPEQLNNLASCCMKLYSRTTLENAKFLDWARVGYAEDTLFNVYALSKVKKIVYYDKCFYHYRRTIQSSLTTKYKEDYTSSVFILYNLLYEAAKDYSCGDDYIVAINNRIVLNILSVVINELKSPSTIEGIKKIKKYICDGRFVSSCLTLDMNQISIPWKIIIYMCKMKSALLLYITFKLIVGIKRN